MPEPKPDDEVISHTGFSFVYNEDHKQSNWVAYMLCRGRSAKVVERPKNQRFRLDPAVKTGTANHDDYTNSRYDRGHLAPCRDLQWSRETMMESFYMSNISPQAPRFNQGIWEDLESLVRDWAIEYDTLYIVTGPVLEKEIVDTIIGKRNRISVPKYYYKVVLNYTSERIEGIGFIMPNEGSTNPLRDYAISIDSVQSFAGINFYYNMPDKKRKRIERSLCVDCWAWK
jgi:endonuclease G